MILIPLVLLGLGVAFFWARSILVWQKRTGQVSGRATSTLPGASKFGKMVKRCALPILPMHKRIQS